VVKILRAILVVFQELETNINMNYMSQLPHSITKIFLPILLTISFNPASAQPNTQATATDTQITADVKEIMRSIDEVKRLPVTGLSFIKAGDKSFLITDNGHFVVAGNFKLVDMWRGKQITSVADTQDIEKVDLRKIGINPDELSTLTVGSGKREVTIFTDPQCDHCHTLISQIEALANDYTFKLVVVPVLGSKSAELTKQLLCNKDKAQSVQALLTKDYSKLPPLVRQEGSCDLKPLQKAVVATKMLEIQAVPLIYLPSHNTYKGAVKSFKTLLEKDLDNQINGK